MNRFVMLIACCLCGISCAAQFRNIKLAEVASISDELHPRIAINHKDPKNIIATILQNQIFSTIDGGDTWSESTLSSSLGVKGHPFLLSDIKGHFYFFHGSDMDLVDTTKKGVVRIVCQESDDKGKTWGKGGFMGLTTKDHDYPSVTTQSKKQVLHLAWTQFDRYGLADANCHSNILFSTSTNGGSKWSKPVQVNQTPGNCNDDANTAVGAYPAVSSDERLFTAWMNQGIIFFDRSYDGGATWLTNDLGISKPAGGGTIKIRGIKDFRIKPVLMIDNSPSRFHGSLYISVTDQKNGVDDADVTLLRSTNLGDQWVTTRVNRDEGGKQQFMPFMAIDQTTGHIFVVYYDRRAYDDAQTDVYLAWSTNGGNSFEETKISETPFVPEGEFSGFTNVAAEAGIITPTWVRVENGKTIVLTAVIKESELVPRK